MRNAQGRDGDPAAGAAAKEFLLAGGQIAAAAAKAEGDLAHRQDDCAIGGDDLPPDDLTFGY